MHNHSNQIQYWQLQEAKAKLSQLIKKALAKGPQGISIRGVPEIIVLSKHDYDQLTQPKQSAWQFFRDSPLVDCNLDLKRDQSLTRDVDL